MEKKISICLTSCNRWDLLEQTIKSLIEHWDGLPPSSFFIHEDQDLSLEAIQVFWSGLNGLVTSLNKDWPLIELSWGKVGQIKAIDLMYAKVQTPYIYHEEDDWTTTKSGFIQKSLSILEENPMISQVWIRHPNDRNGHPAIGQVKTTSDGVKYQMMKTGYRGVWFGHSWNPGLRRLSDYQKLFPNGMYSEIHWSPSNPLQAEQLVGKKYFKNGYRASTLLEGFCLHSGINRHVKG
jgi:hypothetical protein